MSDERRLRSRDNDLWILSNKFREDIKRIFYPTSKSHTILEMGVYRGYTTRFLRGIVGRVVAIDHDESNLRRTRQFNRDRSNITYLRMDLNVADEWDRHLASLKPHCILLDLTYRLH